MSGVEFSSLVHLTVDRAEKQPEGTAFNFFVSDDEELSITYSELDRRAKAIAAVLQDMKLSGERALLLYMPSLDYVTAFLGCLYAGVVAVPAYPPDPHRLNRTLPRLLNIMHDSQAKVIMSTSNIEALGKNMFAGDPQGDDVTWVSTDMIPTENSVSWKEPKLSRASLAFLQYTSGSTSAPRGVMLTHGNLLSNMVVIANSLTDIKHLAGVSWLPPYHDMGLIGGILQPIYSKFTMTLMSPLTFLSDPFSWLKVMSKKRASVSAGPNFAYDLCVRRVTPQERDTLDLSQWRMAANGAEPIRPETMERFADHFAQCGFRKETFFPCYGLAEATLYVCGKGTSGNYSTLSVDAESLEHGIAKVATANTSRRQRLASSGNIHIAQRVCIVHPQTRMPCIEGQIGEIWVTHDSVAQGYFNHPKKTAETFGAHLENGEGPFLRTGDLGFLNAGELYVTGRQKDLIIIRGRNHYPQDIEKTVEECHDNVRPGCVAAFSIDEHGSEELVVTCEVKRDKSKAELSKTFAAISEAISAHHDIRVESVALLKAKSIPKTSSGKIQRHAAKDMFLKGTLDTAKLWRNKKLPAVKSESRDDDLNRLVRKVLGLPASTIIHDSDALTAYGLDSLMRHELHGALEKMVGQKLPANMLDVHQAFGTLRAFLRSQQFVDPPSPPHSAQNSFKDFPEYAALRAQFDGLRAAGLKNPFFTAHEGLVRDTTIVNGKTLVNFSNYNYVGLAGHPIVSHAAKEAIERYGTTVSASRLVSGERPLHIALEKKIASFVGMEDAVVYVSGHATNVSTIACLFGADDLIVYDSLSHNSILQGCMLSQAKTMPFPHNDLQALDSILTQNRHLHRRALIVIEGVYSMDGDIPDLRKCLELKKKHQTFLMIDEAHSIGTLGKSGRGIVEHFGAIPSDVDLLMGTLSKSLASCGGYIAGCKEVIDLLRYNSPGFVYSVGMSPPNAAAALAALETLEQEPWRVKKLHDNAAQFLRLAKQAGLNTGMSHESAVIPVIIGNSMRTLALAERLLEQGINVRPIIYPAVEDSLSRLRFFITSCHTDEQIERTVVKVRQQLEKEECSPCASL